MTKALNLFTLEESIKDEASIREHVEWQRVRLLHAARIRLVGLSHLRIANIVIRTICRTIRVFRPDIRRRRMGQVVVNYNMQDTSSVRRRHMQREDNKQRTEFDELILELVNLVLENTVCMFGHERDKVLELRNVAHVSGDPAIYHDRRQTLTAILRSSIEPMCLKASMAAAYHLITSENKCAPRSSTHKCGGLAV